MSEAREIERAATADRMIASALEALSRADGEAFAALLTDEIEIVTPRSTRTGVEAAREWAAKRYDHLDRRYRITELAHHGAGTVVDACVDYLWRGEDDVADSSAVRFHFELAGDRIARLVLED